MHWVAAQELHYYAVVLLVRQTHQKFIIALYQYLSRTKLIKTQPKLIPTKVDSVKKPNSYSDDQDDLRGRAPSKVGSSQSEVSDMSLDSCDQDDLHDRILSKLWLSLKEEDVDLLEELFVQEGIIFDLQCSDGIIYLESAYTTALEQLKSGKSIASPECKYLLSISYHGLGNRILTAASAFMYALLTDRVLLVDPSHMMDELLCEPFPNTTWPPPRFPPQLRASTSTCRARRRMREDGVLGLGAGERNGSSAPAELPAFAYIHLDYNQTDHDKRFFCDDDQRVLWGIQWLVMRTDSYIVPGLFLVASMTEVKVGGGGAGGPPFPDTTMASVGGRRVLTTVASGERWARRRKGMGTCFHTLESKRTIL
ncbi:hypothetical protein ZWY2020_024572 [Hordeum vulgare]|nr:hypothetical protein ZWY2020_024572 [Hordeum vulgare]